MELPTSEPPKDPDREIQEPTTVAEPGRADTPADQVRSDPVPSDRIGSTESAKEARRRREFRFSLREYLGLVTIAMLGLGLLMTTTRLNKLQTEVDRLRLESGYLAETEPDQIAAARVPSDQPLTYRVRVRVPDGSTGFRVAYSSLWPKGSAKPEWFAAIPVPPGESIVTVRVLEDPRDRRWKIATIVGSTEGNRRIATTLPEKQVPIFRGSHDVISTGIGRETFAVDASQSIRILDERWLVGEEALLLYGSRAPDKDQVGIYAELQPDVDPL